MPRSVLFQTNNTLQTMENSNSTATNAINIATNTSNITSIQSDISTAQSDITSALSTINTLGSAATKGHRTVINNNDNTALTTEGAVYNLCIS